MPALTRSRRNRTADEPRFSRAARALTTLAALAAVAALLVACAPTPPTEAPGITGTVTSLVAGDERPDSIFVEGPAQPAGAISDKAQITVTPTTLFFDAQGKPGGASTIVKGTKVRVWFTGAIAESYPPQGTAKAVQVLAP